MSTLDFRNPFSLEPVGAPGQFFGRVNETQQALQFLDKPEPQCVSVVGPAKIGRTSFLFHIARPRTREHCQLARDHVFVYLDCRSLADYDEGQCCLSLLQETIRQAKGTEGVDRAIATEREKAVSLIESHMPFQGLQTLFRTIENNSIKLVMALDNYESLATNLRVGSNFFSGLRSLSLQITYLVASQSPLDKLERISVGSPFWNIFSTNTVNLGALDPKESQELVATLLRQVGIKFPQCAIDCILELGKDKPYRLQKAGGIAFRVWQANRGSLQAEHCTEIRRQFAKDGNHTERP